MFERWDGRFRDLKLPKKMILVYLVAAAITYGVSMVALQVSIHICEKNLYDRYQQELTVYIQSVEEKMADMESLSLAIALDEQIQEQISAMDKRAYGSKGHEYEQYRLRRLLAKKLLAFDTVDRVVYSDGRDVEIQTGGYGRKPERNQCEELWSFLEDTDGECVFGSAKKEYTYFWFGRKINSRVSAGLRDQGCIAFSVKLSGLFGQRGATLTEKNSALFVYGDEGMIYQEEAPERFVFPQVEEGKGYQVVHYKGRKSFLCYERPEAGGWIYAYLFPYSLISSRQVAVRWMISLVFLLLFVAEVMFMRQVARRITRPLEVLTGSIKIVETGDFERAKRVISGPVRQDEAGILVREIQLMLDKIKDLVDENYEKQLLLKDTEYKMLQAQINPHFLYNTLNALNWMIRAGQNRDASRMIMELGKLLHASFARSPYTTVAEEVATVESYMQIQQFRYRSRAVFSVEKSGSLERYITPRMILQPLVENAIAYGVENSLELCRITVRVREEAEAVILEVADEGAGMTEEELEAVRNFTFIPKGNGIGLKNIYDRLKIAYGESCLYIDSQAGKGTRVEIRLPKKEKEELNV